VGERQIAATTQEEVLRLIVQGNDGEQRQSD
jgi:hypothetical protein